MSLEIQHFHTIITLDITSCFKTEAYKLFGTLLISQKLSLHFQKVTPPDWEWAWQVSQQVVLSSRSERATERMNKNATWTQTQTQIVIQRSIRRVHRINIRMIVPTRVVGQTFNNLVLVNWTTPVQRTRRSNHVLSFLQRTQRAVRHQNRSTLYSVHF